MSDRYIIRNCPAFVQSSYKNRDWAIENACELIDDRCCIKQNCLLKQIVRLCREVNTKFYDSVHQRYLSPSKAKFARQILELLDIQECENE